MKWSVQSCPTLCNPMDCSPPDSSVYRIFQARILEWVAISFSRGSSQPRDRTQVSCTTGRFFINWATRMNYSVTLNKLQFKTAKSEHWHILPTKSYWKDRLQILWNTEKGHKKIWGIPEILNKWNCIEGEKNQNAKFVTQHEEKAVSKEGSTSLFPVNRVLEKFKLRGSGKGWMDGGSLVTGSRFIHLIRIDSNVFLFVAD